MRKEKTLFIVGIWVMVLPFLGFPNFWRQILLFITGLSLTYLAYLFYIEVKTRLVKDVNQSKSFIDNVESGQ